MSYVQQRNLEHSMLHTADVMANSYARMHEPVGGLGVWNGQFEQPGFRYETDAEAWEYHPDASGVIERVSGGLAGYWRVRGGQAGLGTGGELVQLRYMPVDESRRYNIYCASIANDAAATLTFGCWCYDANKAFIAEANIVAAFAPGLAWNRISGSIGPGGGVAWAANTRYARVHAHLSDTARNNNWVYIDDITFWFFNM